MVTPELSPCPRTLATAAAAVATLTTIGILAASIDPALAGATRPHPTLTGSLDEALAILQNNLRTLAAPYLLWLLGLHHQRLGRRAGDVLILALTAASTIPVGIALGRWRSQLAAYVPQLPLEWAALTVAISAWLLIRTHTPNPGQILTLAAVTAGLLAGAAALETWCTPHRAPGHR